MIVESKALPSFWDRYAGLPEDIQRRADKQFAQLMENPRHPSLQLKPLGGFWSARVTDNYRALPFGKKPSLRGSGSGPILYTSNTSKFLSAGECARDLP